MQPSERGRFAACIMACSEVYGRTLSAGAVEVYWRALRHLDIEAVEQALAAHMANPDVGQFMPKPADLLRMVGGTTQDAALVAWAKVDRGVREVGPYQTVCFDDATIMRVVQDMGGWIALCGRGDKEWPFVANEFQNRYRGFRMRNETPDYPATLPGIAEHENGRAGHAQATTVTLIGDAAKARAVMAKGDLLPKPRAVAVLASERLRLVDLK